MVRALWLKARRHRWRRPGTSAALMNLWQASPCQVNHKYILSVDLETTGLDPVNDEIVSMGWVPVVAGRIRLAGAKHLLVKSSAPVDASAPIHGILDADREGGLPLEEALSMLLQAMSGHTLLVHGAKLDIGLLDRVCRSLLGAPLLMPVIDTLEIARQRASRQGQPLAANSLRLITLRQAHGLPGMESHNALADAVATAELALAMLPETRS